MSDVQNFVSYDTKFCLVLLAVCFLNGSAMLLASILIGVLIGVALQLVLIERQRDLRGYARARDQCVRAAEAIDDERVIGHFRMCDPYESGQPDHGNGAD